MNNVAGITIERTSTGKPMYARIDLRKYGRELAPFFMKKGVEIETIHFTPKMKRSLAQAERGEVASGNITNFWDV